MHGWPSSLGDVREEFLVWSVVNVDSDEGRRGLERLASTVVVDASTAVPLGRQWYRAVHA